MSAYTTVEKLLTALTLETNDLLTRDALGDLIVRVSGQFDSVLGFSFAGEYEQGVALTGDGFSRLWIPAPGAADIVTVVEAGTVLDPTLYELERVYGRSLMRLDANGWPMRWSTTPRSCVVQYTPNLPPPEVDELCLRECVRAWNGRASGYQEAVGVEGSNARRATPALATGTIEGLERVKAIYGAVDVTSI